MTGNIGEMIEKKLQEAGKSLELCTGYRLVLLEVPGLEMGNLTIDVTRGSPLFRHYAHRNMLWAVGPAYGQESARKRKEIKEALASEVIQTGRVSMSAFTVDIEKGTLGVGTMLPNREKTVVCLVCGRTYTKEERKIEAQPHRFYCEACLSKAYKEFRSKKRSQRSWDKRPSRATYSLLKEKNFVQWKRPVLSARMIGELATASATPPEAGGELVLPRPFVMFEPGTPAVVWEPDKSDKPGIALRDRCARVRRANGCCQVPVPLEKVIEHYAPEDWDPHPWVCRKPISVPGIIGVQLLVDGRLAGWVRDEELKSSVASLGWLREFPAYEVGDKQSRAREV